MRQYVEEETGVCVAAVALRLLAFGKELLCTIYFSFFNLPHYFWFFFIFGNFCVFLNFYFRSKFFDFPTPTLSAYYHFVLYGHLFQPT